MSKFTKQIYYLTHDFTYQQTNNLQNQTDDKFIYDVFFIARINIQIKPLKYGALFCGFVTRFTKRCQNSQESFGRVKYKDVFLCIEH